jgi:acyl-CoA thioesterase I
MKRMVSLVGVVLISVFAIGQTTAPSPTQESKAPGGPPAATATPAVQSPVPPRLTPLEQQRMTDWAQQSRYRDANAALPAAAAGEQRVIFFGDSITQGWDLAKSFPGKPYVNRGISGQTTPQMLVRFRQDVIALKPEVVVILAGTNDLAGNTGPETLEQIEDNFASMCELAAANNIRVVLSSILPVYDYPWRPGTQPVPKIASLNMWLRSYADAHHLIYLDYFPALADARQGMQSAFSGDGVHPNPAGYAVMAPMAEKAIAQTATKLVEPATP